MDLGYRVASYEWLSERKPARTLLAPGVLTPRYGTLRVRYERARARPGASPEMLTVAPPGVAAELIDLLTARSEGVIDETQFSAMRRRLVKRD